MIKIIRVGKRKHSYDVDHYVNKIKQIEIITIRENKGKNIDLIKQDEGKKLLTKANGFIIALSEEGEQLDSIEFSKLLEKQVDITFLLGGPFGLSQEVKTKANLLLSLSKMTLPHELAFLILVEQIYRAERISEGHPYHK